MTHLVNSIVVFSLWIVLSYGTSNVLDVTCVIPNPLIETTSANVWFESFGGSVDKDIIQSFGRSLDTGPGTNSSKACQVGDNSAPIDCGLPPGTIVETNGSNGTARVSFNDTAEEERIGVFDCYAEKLNTSSTIRTIILNQNAEILPIVLTKTVNLGDTVVLEMNEANVTGEDIGWRFSGSTIIQSGNGTDLTITDAKPSDSGVYECYHEGKEELGRHGIMNLFVRACRADHWNPPTCEKTCPDCYNGGICDVYTGICVCPPGFTGDFCEKGCGHNRFGRDCLLICDADNPSNGCRGRVFCLPEPYGCSCAPGFHGLDCSQECDAQHFGVGCERDCHCPGGSHCDTTTGSCDTGICQDGWYGPQCQTRILDFTVYNESPLVNLETPTVTEQIRGYVNPPDFDASMYTGRLEYTGTGNVGLGVAEPERSSGVQPVASESGFPDGTTIQTAVSSGSIKNLRVTFLSSAANETIGVYYIDGFKYGALVKIATFKSAEQADLWPERYTITTGVGESATLSVNTSLSIASHEDIRWRHNNGDVIHQWNGLLNVTIARVRKSDEGIYECYINGNRTTGNHAIMRLIVRDCPMTKWGFDCSEDCPVCYNGGMCDDKTGLCVCPAGFEGDDCSVACGDNNWGRSCGIVCSDSNPGCPDRLFCVQDPVGCSCIAGYYGNDCASECAPGYYGANCEQECHCDINDCDRAEGCTDGSCFEGYAGPQCQEPEDECPLGYYGILCKSQCHCVDSAGCERSNGTCSNGCANGWAGSDCQQALPQLTDNPKVFEVKRDSATVTWNSWRYGYDYGTGPVVRYTLEYREAQSDDVTSVEVVDSVARPKLSPFIVYQFRVQAMRDVEGAVIGGLRTEWVAAKTLCGVPIASPTINGTNAEGPNAISLSWTIPDLDPSWLRCEVDSFIGYAITVNAKNDPLDTQTLYASVADTSIYVYNLMVCTVYELQLRVNNTVGEGPDSWPPEEIQTDSIAPSPLDNLDISTVSNSELLIKWTEPASTCEVTDYIFSYQLIKRDQCEDVDGVIVGGATPNTETTLSFLEDFSTYQISVLARSRGVAGDAVYGNGTTDEGAPTGPPTTIIADNTLQLQLSFSWNQPECGSRHGDVFVYDCKCLEDREGAKETFKSTNVPTVTFTENMEYYTWYNFTVRAKTSVDDVGPWAETIQVLSAEGVPASAPRNITVINSYSRSLNVSWLIPETPNGIVYRYEIVAINTDSGIPSNFVALDTEELIIIYYELTELLPDQRYRIEIKAFTSAGGGPMSNPVAGRTLPLPTSPPPTRRSTTPTHSTLVTTRAINTSPLPPGLNLPMIIFLSTTSGLLLILLIIVICVGIQCSRKRKRPRTTDPGYYMDNVLAEDRRHSNNTYDSRGHPIPPPEDRKSSGIYEDIPDNKRYTIAVDDYNTKIYDAGYISPSDFQTQFSHEMYNEGTYFIPVDVGMETTDYGPIKIGELPAYVKHRKTSEENNFSKEFTDLPEDESQSSPSDKPPVLPPPRDNPYETKFETKQNTYDNRLNNKTSVRLSDEINAVFIHGHKKPNAYISASGPHEDNVDDWWYLVWDKCVVTIVMTTDTTEDGETICEKYWPDEGELKTYGMLTVQSTEEEKYAPHCTMRTLELTKKGSDEVRQVKHFQVLNWPREDEPMAMFIQPLLITLDKVKALNPAAGAPILVHCSTGSGRTGVVIAVDAMLDMKRGSEGKVGVFDFVRQMRNIRYQMVETETQYAFIYDALLEDILAKKTRIREHEFTEVYGKLQKVNPRTQTSRLDDQFLALECILPVTGDEQEDVEAFAERHGMPLSTFKSPSADQGGYINTATIGRNRPKSLASTSSQQTLIQKDDNCIGDETILYIPRPSLPGNSRVQENALKAVYIEGFVSPKAFLVIPKPETNIGEFWQCVYSSNSQAIVMLEDTTMDCSTYWPQKDTELVHEPFTIEVLEEISSESVTERIVKLSTGKGTDKEESRKLKQFQYHVWPASSSIPNSTESFLGLMKSVALWQTNQSKDNPNKRRVTVHCSDGLKSALFCVLANILDQLQVERVVDVYHNVKKHRSSHTDMLNSKEQFIFLYECIKQQLTSLPAYAGVQSTQPDQIKAFQLESSEV